MGFFSELAQELPSNLATAKPLITEGIGALGSRLGFLGGMTQRANSGFGISDFMYNIEQNDEVAYADLFNVTINLPPRIGDHYGARQLALTCEQAELPGVEIQPVTYRHYGFTKYLPRSLQYGQLALTFYVTGAMMEKRVFDDWINMCIGFSGNGPGLISYRFTPDGSTRVYESDIQINQYDKAGNPTYWARAMDCFPTSVQQMNLSWSDQGQAHRLSVNFVFTKWLTDAHNPDGEQVPTMVTNYTNQPTQQVESFLSNIVGHTPLVNPLLKL